MWQVELKEAKNIGFFCATDWHLLFSFFRTSVEQPCLLEEV